ncbi:MAG: DUF4838 domain-containing protein [Armatimonadetes bacterium]|nr:DUF4838 domain-containing protein [Armatimonadota bacterium]
MKASLTAILLALVLSASAAGARNGRDTMIIIPDEPSPVVTYAAKELQYFIAKSTGTRPAIVAEKHAVGRHGFVLGPCRRSGGPEIEKRLGELREDGVLIKTVGDDVILLGQNDRGQLYTVYVLLEKYLGVRFLARDCTIIPKHDKLDLPEIDYAYTPPFMYRETLYWDSFPKEIAARQRLNGPWSKCDEEVGGNIRIEPYVHSFARLVPPEKYFAEHPEYFSLVGGKRTNLTVHGQLCLTNPDVLEIATEQVLKWIADNPEVPIFDVSQNDGNGPCECDKCMAVVNEEGSQHGPILRFVNAIADEVAKKYPDKWIETLAYAYSTKPPSITRPRRNVIIRLCHAGCYFHGFEECGLGANLAANLDAWSKVTDNIFIWHYAANFAHYIAPCQNLDGLVKDIRYYAAHNVRGLMIQADYQSPGGEMAELRQYLAARLMWDPSRSPGVIRREFCNGYYGAAAGDVLRYVMLLDRAALDPGRHAFGAWDPKTTFADAWLVEGLKILEKARSRKLTAEQAQRVDRLFLPLWYLQLTYPDAYGFDTAKAPALVQEFKRIAQASKITHINEGALVDQWLAGMESKYH